MTSEQLLKEMRDGVRVRYLSKSVVYSEVRGIDSLGLYIGRELIVEGKTPRKQG